MPILPRCFHIFKLWCILFSNCLIYIFLWEVLFLNNDTMYKMFLNTLAKMNDDELQVSLTKAKELLSEHDYENLIKLIEKERFNNHN